MWLNHAERRGKLRSDPVNLNMRTYDHRITPEIETQLKETAQTQGVSVGRYIENLVAETSLRHIQISEFQTAIAERMASLNTGVSVEGEGVIARLVTELTPR